MASSFSPIGYLDGYCQPHLINSLEEWTEIWGDQRAPKVNFQEKSVVAVPCSAEGHIRHITLHYLIVKVYMYTLFPPSRDAHSSPNTITLLAAINRPAPSRDLVLTETRPLANKRWGGSSRYNDFYTNFWDPFIETQSRLEEKEKLAKERYGSVLFNRVKNHKDAEKVAKIDSKIVRLFHEIIDLRDACQKRKEGAIEKFRDITRDLKGPYLGEITNESPLKRRKR